MSSYEIRMEGQSEDRRCTFSKLKVGPAEVKDCVLIKCCFNQQNFHSHGICGARSQDASLEYEDAFPPI